jgi:hypothetical protein
MADTAAMSPMRVMNEATGRIRSHAMKNQVSENFWEIDATLSKLKAKKSVQKCRSKALQTGSLQFRAYARVRRRGTAAEPTWAGANPSPGAPPRARHVPPPHTHTTRRQRGPQEGDGGRAGTAGSQTKSARAAPLKARPTPPPPPLALTPGSAGWAESDSLWSASMLHRRRRGARAARGSGVDDKVRAAFLCICSEN